MRKILIGLALLCFALPAHAQLSAEEAQSCTGNYPPVERIANCTRLIESGHLAPVNVPFAYFARGQSNELLHEYSKAIDDFNTAIGHNPNFAQAYAHLGFVHYQLKLYDQAITDENKSISLSSNQLLSYLVRGGAYHFKGLDNQAVGDFRTALKLDPNNKAALSSLRAMGVTP